MLRGAIADKAHQRRLTQPNPVQLTPIPASGVALSPRRIHPAQTSPAHHPSCSSDVERLTPPENAFWKGGTCHLRPLSASRERSILNVPRVAHVFFVYLVFFVFGDFLASSIRPLPRVSPVFLVFHVFRVHFVFFVSHRLPSHAIRPSPPIPAKLGYRASGESSVPSICGPRPEREGSECLPKPLELTRSHRARLDRHTESGPGSRHPSGELNDRTVFHI